MSRTTLSSRRRNRRAVAKHRGKVSRVNEIQDLKILLAWKAGRLLLSDVSSVIGTDHAGILILEANMVDDGVWLARELGGNNE